MNMHRQHLSCLVSIDPQPPAQSLSRQTLTLGRTARSFPSTASVRFEEHGKPRQRRLVTHRVRRRRLLRSSSLVVVDEVQEGSLLLEAGNATRLLCVGLLRHWCSMPDCGTAQERRWSDTVAHWRGSHCQSGVAPVAHDLCGRRCLLSSRSRSRVLGHGADEDGRWHARKRSPARLRSIDVGLHDGWGKL